MAEISRSQKSVKNMAISISSNVAIQIMHFVVRSVFLYTLGANYNGLDGLFSNILTMLSLADLGVGVAMAHTYYKPLAEKDEYKIKALVNLYSKIYTCIGLVIFTLGMAIMPFLDVIIGDIESIRKLGLNVEFIYFWYVLNSAISYMFCAYKQTLLIADQKAYVVKNIQMFFTFFTAFAQISFLLIFRGKAYVYYLYLISNILLQIARNLYTSNKCNKVYPFLKIKEKTRVLKEDINKLIKDVHALLLYRISIVVLSGSNNIIISKFLADGIKNIGSYTNYTFLIGAVNTMLTQIFEAITASVGNLVAGIKKGVTQTSDKAYKTFKALHFANFWFFGMCSVVLWVMLDPFVRFWLGKTDILFMDKKVIFALVMNFYVTGVQMSTTAFRNAYGLFQQGKYRPVVMTILNIVFSIVFIQKFGLVGVFAGNILSRLLTVAWFDPYIVYKYGFNKSIFTFLRDYVIHFFIIIALGFVTEKAVCLFPADNLLWLILRAVVAVIISNGVLLIIYGKSEEFKFIFVRIKNMIKKTVK